MTRTSVFAFALTFACLATACVDEEGVGWEADALPGVRLEYGCPNGESCSDGIEHGLQVRSEALSEQPFITALGGTQTFVVEYPDGTPLDIAFTATAQSPEIEIVSVGQGRFTVRGAAAGAANVDLRDPATGLLYDRFYLFSKPIADVGVSSISSTGWLGLGADGIYVGTEIPLSVRLLSPDRIDGFLFDSPEYMADESIIIEAGAATDPVISVRQERWNRGVMTAGRTLGAGSLEVRAGGAVYSFDVAVVDTVEELYLLPPGDVVVGGSGSVCVIPSTATASRVVGVPLVFDVSGPVTWRAVGNECIELTPDATGTIVVTVSAPGATASISFPAVAAE